MPTPLPVSTVLRACLHELDLTHSELRDKMRVSKRTVWKLVNGRQRLTANMAGRLATATGKPAREWLMLQADYELAQERGKR